MQVSFLLILATLCIVSVQAKIGSFCSDTNECRVDTRDSLCTNKYKGCRPTCVCKGGDFHRPGTNGARGACVMQPSIGDECETDAECLFQTKNSQCVQKKSGKFCRCGIEDKPHHVGDDKYCGDVKTGQECTKDDDQCITYVVDPESGGCFNGICGCAPRYKILGEVQCVGYGINENCTHNEHEDKVCEVDTGLECLPAVNGIKQCLCPAETVCTSNNEACVSTGASNNLPEGSPCNEHHPWINTALICHKSLKCDRCPGESHFTCKQKNKHDDATQTMISLVTLATAFMVATQLT